jgi:tetratricopeptide (TPR) repeat protein
MRDIEILKDIDRYLNGEMSTEEIDQLWGKFIEKPEYFELLKTEAHARKYFQKKMRGDTPAEEKGFWSSNVVMSYKNWIYTLAAVLIIFVLFQLTTVSSTAGLQSELLGSISPHEMVTVEIYRTTEPGFERLDIEINKGYEAAVSGRLDESKEHFLHVLDSDPTPAQKAVANLNMGILFFNNADFEEASAAFKTVTENENLSAFTLEKGWWYLGQSLARQDYLDDARQAVNKAYQLDGLFRQEAELLLKILDEILDK